MADDRDLFGDLGDFDDLGLDETPSFDFGEEELVEFAPPQEEGIGRTFKIVGALIGLGVVVIVVLLVVFALGGGDELTANEKTSTAVAIFNASEVAKFDATLTALALIEQATQTQVRIVEVTGTAAFFQQQTIAAQRATDQANTATAEFAASQTAAVQQTATQEALNEQMTVTAESNRLFGRVVDKDGNIFGNATLRLYRDDGDGQFTPADRTPVPGGGGGAGLSPGEGGSGAGTGASSGEPQPINYGEIAQGTVGRGEIALWTFTGTRGDSVIINAIASDPVQMDMFLELVGPDGSMLIGDDDSGEESNAAITGFALPQDGKYTIRVSSVAGPGSYTLLLSLGLTVPGPAVQPTAEESGQPTEEAPAEEPTQETTGQTGQLVPGGEGIVLAHSGASQGEPGVMAQEATATPETLPTDTPVPPPTDTPAPPTGDELIIIITTATDGTFDFGTLEPGVYWVELDYDSLPPDLKELVEPGQPLVIKVTVPVQGEFIFEVGAELPPTPVPTGVGSPSPFELTATAFGARTGTPPVDIVTLTPSVEPGETLAMPETGFFSDMGDKGDDIDGTSALTVLAIAAAGLVAVVFIARKLRNSA